MHKCKLGFNFADEVRAANAKFYTPKIRTLSVIMHNGNTKLHVYDVREYYTNQTTALLLEIFFFWLEAV